MYDHKDLQLKNISKNIGLLYFFGFISNLIIYNTNYLVYYI